uniref:Uncharacterized protein n=1 Tax=Utricularia reniformis TaxID=192314 RepID=A0A1Y0B0Y3_9LAMI|nr:hypothetical protein AEK19_MT0812 [Utricularia reniformis]ART31047.1 hypothetical protein AEK19_MT0812 [Utricularia reniformis]
MKGIPLWNSNDLTRRVWDRYHLPFLQQEATLNAILLGDLATRRGCGRS